MGEGITLNQRQTGVLGLNSVLNKSSRKARIIGEFPALHGKNTREYLIDSKRGGYTIGSSIDAIKNTKTGSTTYKYTAYIDRAKEKGSFGTNLVHVTAYDDNGDGLIDRYIAQDVKMDHNVKGGSTYYNRYFVNDCNNGYGDGKYHFKEVKELPSNYAWYDPRGWFE